MSSSLAELVVLALDCQSSGATPAHGDILELGWGVSSGVAEVLAPEAEWVTRATARPVTKAVRDLTGWSEKASASSIAPLDAWARLLAAAEIARQGDAALEKIPTVIHFARFELPFLRLLHEQAGGAPETFPFDIVCLHSIACRLFPLLPRRNLRALAGHLGGAAHLVRRSKGHVEASAFVWRALVPRLAAEGVTTWEELRAWLDTPVVSSRSRSSGREFPITSARRRALPDVPGVYRFLRPNGDVLYVGKAASLKRRVASHFTTGSRATERSLEMLSQAHDIDVTPVATALEAALLETDEIKRLDPPYNVHLRTAERFAWFASRDWSSTASAIDAVHRVGPLPSRFSVAGIAAIRALLLGEPSNPRLRAAAVGVPVAFAPDAALFDPVWSELALRELSGRGSEQTRVLAASARIVPTERPDDEESTGAAPAPQWDAAAVRRYLERTIVGEGSVVRRARAIALLSDAHVVFREPDDEAMRLLVIEGGAITSSRPWNEADLGAIARPPPLATRLAGFDAGRYDRLRVLVTELRRIVVQGGLVEVRIGRHIHRPRP